MMILGEDAFGKGLLDFFSVLKENMSSTHSAGADWHK